MTPSSAPLYPEQPVPQEESETVVCTSCGMPKPIGDFHRDKRRHNGLSYRCKECTNKYKDKLKENLKNSRSLVKEKTCVICKIPQPLGNFYDHTSCLYGKRNECISCMSVIQQEKWIKNPRPPELNRKKNKRWRDENKEYTTIKREERSYKSYAASEEWYYLTLESQNGRCAICGSEKPRINGGKRFAIDHNHNCCGKNKACNKCRRGLLCGVCNTMLSVLENPNWVKQAKAYLRKFPLKDASGNEQPSLFDGM
jgi:hypothetical protein